MLVHWLTPTYRVDPPSEETLHPLLKRASWSFNIALQGRRPAATVHDDQMIQLTPKQKQTAGTCLATTWALTECRGDWQWHICFFRMWTHYWKCGTICFKCNAARIGRHRVDGENLIDPWIFNQLKKLILPLEYVELVVLSRSEKCSPFSLDFEWLIYFTLSGLVLYLQTSTAIGPCEQLLSGCRNALNDQ